MRVLRQRRTPVVLNKSKYDDKHSKHRHVMRIYELNPAIFDETFVAPNASVIGEVFIGQECVIGYGTVIRGDLNGVKISPNVVIGENTVISTVSSLPTGLPASVSIGILKPKAKE